MAKLIIDCGQKLKGIKKIAKAVYTSLNQKDKLKAELVFVSAEEIKELNNQTRNIDKVTDVLSYPSLDGVRDKVILKDDHSTSLDENRVFIGSIVMCNDKIKEQAIEYGHSEDRERTYLLVHGLMHLFGYDHIEDADKKQMREKEKLALAKLGIKE